MESALGCTLVLLHVTYKKPGLSSSKIDTSGAKTHQKKSENVIDEKERKLMSLVFVTFMKQ